MEKNKQKIEANTQNARFISRRNFLAKTAVFVAGLAILSSCAAANQTNEIGSGGG
jgi:hypothetical protein